MADEEADLMAIAWPGFVDILSSVLIMFVFFTMIVAVALYFHTIIFKSKIIQEARESQNENVTKQVEMIVQQKKGLEDKVAAMNEKINQLYANLAKSVTQKTTVNETDDEMIVFFSDKAITVTPETKTEVEEFIAKHIQASGNKGVKVVMQGVKNPDAPTESVARTVAFARLFNVRNVLLQKEQPAGSISVNLVPAEEVEGSYHWVRIKIIRQ